MLTVKRAETAQVFFLTLTFAKGFVMNLLRALQWTRRVHTALAVDFSCCVFLARFEWVAKRCYAFAKKPVHFFDLAVRDSNWILHNSPMVGLFSAVWDKRATV